MPSSYEASAMNEPSCQKAILPKTDTRRLRFAEFRSTLNGYSWNVMCCCYAVLLFILIVESNAIDVYRTQVQPNPPSFHRAHNMPKKNRDTQYYTYKQAVRS